MLEHENLSHKIYNMYSILLILSAHDDVLTARVNNGEESIKLPYRPSKMIA